MDSTNEENNQQQENSNSPTQGKKVKQRVKDNKYNIIGETITILLGAIGFFICLLNNLIPLALLIFAVSLLLARFVGFAIRNYFEKNKETKQN